MKTDLAHDVTKAFDDEAPIDEALAQAARAALLRHKQAGLPVAVWRDGAVAWVPAEEIDPALAGEKDLAAGTRDAQVSGEA